MSNSMEVIDTDHPKRNNIAVSEESKPNFPDIHLETNNMSGNIT